MDIQDSYPSATDAEARASAIELQRLALVQAQQQHQAHLSALAAMEAAQQARHIAAMNAAEIRHADNQQQADIRALRLALAATLGPDVTPDEIARLAAERWPVIDDPGETGPNEFDAPWYLSQLGQEFARYGQPQTLDFARSHWRAWGKKQGRKGRADGPGWGPRMEDAPPGLVL